MFELVIDLAEEVIPLSLNSRQEEVDNSLIDHNPRYACRKYWIRWVLEIVAQRIQHGPAAGSERVDLPGAHGRPNPGASTQCNAAVLLPPDGSHCTQLVQHRPRRNVAAISLHKCMKGPALALQWKVPRSPTARNEIPISKPTLKHTTGSVQIPFMSCCAQRSGLEKPRDFGTSQSGHNSDARSIHSFRRLSKALRRCLHVDMFADG